MKKSSFGKKLLLISTLLVCSVLIVFFVYSSIYYKASSLAIESSLSATKSKNYLTFYPEKRNLNSDTAIIFYPGGKVDYLSYAPLLKKLSQNGFVCFLVKMPFNLAVFNPNAALQIKNNFPEIKNWAIAGHSLGGAMAASFASKNPFVSAVILLASYSTKELNVPVLSIYGENDLVLNKQKYLDSKSCYKNKVFFEYVISGGNHAQFGLYGDQNGDGKANISCDEQLTITTNVISKWLISNY